MNGWIVGLNGWALSGHFNELVEYLLFSDQLLPLASCIFLIGLTGFLESRDFLSVLINVEVMMLGINFCLIAISILLGDYIGQLYALCFLAVTAAETAIGLGLLILLYRAKGRISFSETSTLKG